MYLEESHSDMKTTRSNQKDLSEDKDSENVKEGLQHQENSPGTGL